MDQSWPSAALRDMSWLETTSWNVMRMETGLAQNQTVKVRFRWICIIAIILWINIAFIQHLYLNLFLVHIMVFNNVSPFISLHINDILKKQSLGHAYHAHRKVTVALNLVVCVVVRVCPSPHPLPQHLHASVQSFTLKAVMSLACSEGYSLQGSEILQCEIDSNNVIKWNGTFPNCQGV